MNRTKHANALWSPVISRLKNHEVPVAKIQYNEAIKLKDKVLAMIKMEQERAKIISGRVVSMQSMIRDGRVERDKLREEVRI